MPAVFCVRRPRCLDQPDGVFCDVCADPHNHEPGMFIMPALDIRRVGEEEDEA